LEERVAEPVEADPQPTLAGLDDGAPMAQHDEAEELDAGELEKAEELPFAMEELAEAAIADEVAIGTGPRESDSVEMEESRPQETQSFENHSRAVAAYLASGDSTPAESAPVSDSIEQAAEEEIPVEEPAPAEAAPAAHKPPDGENPDEPEARRGFFRRILSKGLDY